MTTITLKINENSKAGKTVLSMLDFFISEKKEVIVVEKNSIENNKDIYDQDFVKIILKSQKSKNRAIVTAENLWENI